MNNEVSAAWGGTRISIRVSPRAEIFALHICSNTLATAFAEPYQAVQAAPWLL
ncbi:hypothetical protein N5K55_03065 (plasmid) [Pseudomonas aeruginosa]|nr:hypothetical protein [Pseudomonas aeruginosa]